MTGAIEGMEALASGKFVSLSEQNIIDCSGKYYRYAIYTCPLLQLFMGIWAVVEVVGKYHFCMSLIKMESTLNGVIPTLNR